MNYLPGNQNDLTKVRWAHAVNCEKFLIKALEADDVDMVEADVSLGRIDNDPKAKLIPVMAHDDQDPPTLSLSNFLHDFMKYNREQESKNEKLKGLKLDFKSIEAFEMSFTTLKAIYPLISFQLWLNADILEGPGISANDSTPVDPDRFLVLASELTGAVLSVGWTTNWDAALIDEGYNEDHIDFMIDVLESNRVHNTRQKITFPVRAGLAANSVDEMKRLLEYMRTTNKCTLTVWSHRGDYVDAAKLRAFIDEIGTNSIYLDVPEELELELFIVEPSESPANSSSWTAVVVFAAAALVLMFATAIFSQNK